MRRQLLPAVAALLALTVLTGVAYPLAVWGVGRAAFRSQADGSLVRVGGEVVGSRLLGQAFSRPDLFHPRPSAAGADGYDATASGPSNLGPTSAALLDAVARRAAAYRAENGLADDVPLPGDAVTSSASGLDPDISPANARLQAGRVARARGLPQATVLALVRAHTEGRILGIFGEPRVDVLQLNLALEAAR